MFGIGVFFLGVLMAATHNTPGDLVVGISLAAIGLALWVGPNVNRIR